MDIEHEGKEIDKFLRKNEITKVKKRDLVAKFNLHSDKRTAIYSVLINLGWTEYWQHFERQ